MRMRVCPVPSPMKHRPGARRLIVAMPSTTAGASRRPGTLTPVPRRMRRSPESEHRPAVGADHQAVGDPAMAVPEVLRVSDVADLVHLGRDDPEVHVSGVAALAHDRKTRATEWR